jgi:hypothetical protein
MNNTIFQNVVENHNVLALHQYEVRVLLILEHTYIQSVAQPAEYICM